jgi:hypothetical protein
MNSAHPLADFFFRLSHNDVAFWPMVRLNPADELLL